MKTCVLPVALRVEAKRLKSNFSLIWD